MNNTNSVFFGAFKGFLLGIIFILLVLIDMGFLYILQLLLNLVGPSVLIIGVLVVCTGLGAVVTDYENFFRE